MRRTLSLASLLLLAGCSAEPTPPRCDATAPDGTCTGVTQTELCGEPFCTGEVACATMLRVQQGAAGGGDGSESRPLASLEEAASMARPGDCVVLAAGSYTAASFSGGVRVLGRGAAQTTISGSAGGAALRFADGQGGLLRGVRLSGDGRGLGLRNVTDFQVQQVLVEAVREAGLEARQASSLHLEHVTVKGTRAGDGGGFGIGIMVEASTAARLEAVAVEGSAAQGVLVADSSLELTSSTITGSGSYGLAVDCQAAACQTELATRVSASRFEQSGGVGLWARTGTLSVERSEIAGVRARQGLARGAELQQVLKLELRDNKVRDSDGLGVLVDSSAGMLAQNVIESNQDRGLWLQNLGGLSLEDNQLVGNAVAGLGLIACTAVKVSGGRVAQTRAVPVLVGEGAATIGDGIQVLAGSSAAISRLHVEENQRLAVLVDAAQLDLTDSVLLGGSDLLVLQNVTETAGTFSNNTGKDSQPVEPLKPATPYVVDRRAVDLVSFTPIPLP